MYLTLLAEFAEIIEDDLGGMNKLLSEEELPVIVVR